MSDFEYYATIGFFIAGLIALPILFHYRKKLIRMARIKMNIAKAKIHRATRPKLESVDPWNNTPDHIVPAPKHTWGAETYREREIR